MKTNTKKILTAIVTILIVISMLAINAFAITPGEITPVQPTDGGLKNMAEKIIGVLQVIGVAVAVIILAVLGIKYMLGSAEEKAEYKKAFMPYIIGAALVFMAPTLANIVYSFFIGTGS